MNFLKQSHQPFFRFFNFTSEGHNKNHHLSPNSHWTITAADLRLSQPQIYPESTIFENTRRLSHGQLTITHENYLRS